MTTSNSSRREPPGPPSATGTRSAPSPDVADQAHRVVRRDPVALAFGRALADGAQQRVEVGDGGGGHGGGGHRRASSNLCYVYKLT